MPTSLITLIFLTATCLLPAQLLITGVIDGDLSGGLPKAVELYAMADIVDLSVYGFGSANNGEGSDGEEFTFPAVAVTAGSFIYVASESPQFSTFFGFAPTYTSGTANINGDDAIELYGNGTVVDTFGDIHVDGSGTSWEYADGWAYRVDGTIAGAATFTASDWIFSGINALDGASSNATSAMPFPVASFREISLVPEPTALSLMTGIGALLSLVLRRRYNTESRKV